MRVLVDFHFYVKFLSGTRGFELGILGRIKATIKWFDFWSFDKCVSLISTLMDCKEQGNYALLLVQKNAENGQVNCHKKQFLITNFACRFLLILLYGMKTDMNTRKSKQEKRFWLLGFLSPIPTANK